MSGRPTKLTAQMQEAICTALEKGNTRTSAALLAGINRATLYRWMQEHASFCDAIEKAEAEAQERLLHRIRVAAEVGMTVTRKDGEVVEYPGAWQAAAWILERRWPTQYGRTSTVEMTGKDGGPIEVTQGLNDHEVVLLRQAIDRERSAREPA